MGPSAPRADMVANAVSFLEDPNVQSSSMSQRISFLESKGLTSQEIDRALSQVGRAPPPLPPSAPYPMMPAYPPARPQRDWRDWFIMAVVSGTVGYGVVSLARRYLYPHPQPPDKTASWPCHASGARQYLSIDLRKLAQVRGPHNVERHCASARRTEIQPWAHQHGSRRQRERRPHPTTETRVSLAM